MIGLGVGIDYSLFIVTRYRELLADGVEPPEAVARATAQLGRRGRVRRRHGRDRAAARSCFARHPARLGARLLGGDRRGRRGRRGADAAAGAARRARQPGQLAARSRSAAAASATTTTRTAGSAGPAASAKHPWPALDHRRRRSWSCWRCRCSTWSSARRTSACCPSRHRPPGLRRDQRRASARATNGPLLVAVKLEAAGAERPEEAEPAQRPDAQQQQQAEAEATSRRSRSTSS